jgi:hypothetical protein
MFRSQCLECGFGDREIGHLAAETEIYSVVGGRARKAG